MKHLNEAYSPIAKATNPSATPIQDLLYLKVKSSYLDNISPKHCKLMENK